jgi:hypothetical protein
MYRSSMVELDVEPYPEAEHYGQENPSLDRKIRRESHTDPSMRLAGTRLWEPAINGRLREMVDNLGMIERRTGNWARLFEQVIAFGRKSDACLWPARPSA